ncbi:Rho guanine nucleotide exchange factor 2 [Dissostichus eleginoides]|uniref:Rho guanine nucleotide exchange factor 2 n=1 Tax=Dissostichus eleginoides TaxID=100907 RepID=A0AAD9C5A9_DISEL|nr:Rho guanine nucleotide exchange factor 2 [Dissostichus eleginoides]
MKERPSSAIYPSDSLRQSLLGSRRVRSGLSLAKSVSTNNIAGMSEDSVGLRRILSQSTESLNFRSRTLSMESLTDDGEWWWSPLLEELQEEGRCVQADSWSLVVEPKFLQSLHKDLIKKQDVIYELIQTEFHHVRTLRIMEGVYRRGMLEEVLQEAAVVHTIFPCLDQLLEWHSNFLSELLARRKEGLMEGSGNFTVRRIGDLRHPKAVKLYKEVLTRDRKLQQFIRRACRGPLLRRHGVQECILLVTQRITKYPVLIQRILDNTKGSEEESQALTRALLLLKGLISSVDQEVLELDRTRRLQEVQARLDPRAQAEVQGGGEFRGGELLRRRLLYEGPLLWKVQGSRMKVHLSTCPPGYLSTCPPVYLSTCPPVYLSTCPPGYLSTSPPVHLSTCPPVHLDTCPPVHLSTCPPVYLSTCPPGYLSTSPSEKDQKFTFPSLVSQTWSLKDLSVLWSLKDLLVLWSLKDLLVLWSLKDLLAPCSLKDLLVLWSLKDLLVVLWSLKDLLAPWSLKDLLVLWSLKDILTLDIANQERGMYLISASCPPEMYELHASSKEGRKTWMSRIQQAAGSCPSRDEFPLIETEDKALLRRLRADIQQKDREVLELLQERVTLFSDLVEAEQLLLTSIAEVDRLSELLLDSSLQKNDRNGNQLQERSLNQEVRQRLVSLSTQLHALQAAVIRQDSILELSLTTGPAPSLPTGPALTRSLSGEGGEAGLLRRQVELLQEEVTRLRLKGEEPIREGAGSRRRSNGDISDVMKGEPEPVDQLDGVQETNGEKISPRSDSPRDLQDIPEESECGAEPS